MKKLVLTILVLALTSIAAQLAFTYSQQPPPAGHANDPGQANCTACHTSFPLQTSGTLWNNITLTSSVPLTQFVPGQTYSMSLTFSNPASVKYGFEMVVLPASPTASSASLGTLSNTTAFTAVNGLGNRDYVSHTFGGTSAPSNTKTWNFDWTAPASLTGLRFYVVVNSTNNDGTNSGDMIFAKVFSGNVLPVKWLSYELEPQNKGTLIKWSTATEVNNNHFEVERSTDRETWTTVAEVKGAGNSSTRKDYVFFDQTTSASGFYYRIQQVDFDGNNDYSRVLFSGKVLGDDIVVYDPQTSHISISNDMHLGNAVLYNLAGKPVKEDMMTGTMDVSNLDKGIYVLQLPTGKVRKIYVY